MDEVEVIVVGAGAVGLAIARAEAEAGREVAVLEREGTFGLGVSSRSSEVIHAGLFYPPGSLKARLCIRGRRLLMAYCAERHIPHRQCGKLVTIANDAHLDLLALIVAMSEPNGLRDDDKPVRLTAAEAHALEPALRCRAALLSPGTGIIDSHALMLNLLGDAERAGAWVAYATPFAGARRTGSGFEVVTGGSAPHIVRCRRLINAGGLDAQAVARRIEDYPADRIPRAEWSKGSYFRFDGASPFRRLIYPIGGHDFSVHVTLDLGGRTRFGPDAEMVTNLDYAVDPDRISRFEAAIRIYWPDLPAASLTPDYAGIRPKLVASGGFVDFVIDGPDAHGIAGLINLFGIESPGLTSCLAIGEYVASI